MIKIEKYQNKVYKNSITIPNMYKSPKNGLKKYILQLIIKRCKYVIVYNSIMIFKLTNFNKKLNFMKKRNLKGYKIYLI